MSLLPHDEDGRHIPRRLIFIMGYMALILALVLAMFANLDNIPFWGFEDIENLH